MFQVVPTLSTTETVIHDEKIKVPKIDPLKGKAFFLRLNKETCCTVDGERAVNIEYGNIEYGNIE